MPSGHATYWAERPAIFPLAAPRARRPRRRQLLLLHLELHLGVVEVLLDEDAGVAGGAGGSGPTGEVLEAIPSSLRRLQAGRPMIAGWQTHDSTNRRWEGR